MRGRDGGVRTPWAWAMDCFFAWPLPNMTSGVRARLGADDAPSVYFVSLMPRAEFATEAAMAALTLAHTLTPTLILTLTLIPT